MIHHVFIIDANDDIVVNRRTVDEELKLDVDEPTVRQFALRIKESQSIVLDVSGPNKLAGGPLGRGVVIICAQRIDRDEDLNDRLEEVTDRFRQVISYEVDYDAFLAKVIDYIIIRLKVSIIGNGGVGKTSFVTLLNGGKPTTGYNPTVGLAIDTIKAPRIGTYEIVTWDFAGQQRFHKLWELYLRGSHAVLLVTDSTLENVLDTLEILKWVRSHRDLEVAPLAIANKQDLPGALAPQLVERILGVKTYSMVAVDLANRDKALSIIYEALGPRF